MRRRVRDADCPAALSNGERLAPLEFGILHLPPSARPESVGQPNSAGR